MAEEGFVFSVKIFGMHHGIEQAGLVVAESASCVTTVTAGVKGAASALATAAPTLLPVVAVAGGGVVLAVLYLKYKKQIHEKLESAWQYLAKEVNKGFEAVMGALKAVKDYVQKSLDKLLEWLQSFFETQDTEETRETQETQETGETRETQETQETRETRETQETQETGKTRETQETQETGETRETQETQETREHEKHKKHKKQEKHEKHKKHKIQEKHEKHKKHKKQEKTRRAKKR